VVVGGWEHEIDNGMRIFSYSTETKCKVLDIDLAMKSLMLSVVGTYRVRLIQSLWWW
jgi:hypothetical protein